MPTDFTTSAVRYKDIPDFPGYRVGDDGSVWSCWVRIPIAIGGPAGLRGSKTVLGTTYKPLRLFWNGPAHYRYRYVNLQRDGKLTMQRVSRLVLSAFIGPCPLGMEARHFPDRDRDNNRLENLSWGSRQENQADRVVHGTSNRGERSYRTKLTEKLVRVIRQRSAEGEPNWLLAQEFKVAKSTIIAIVLRKSWAWLDAS